MPVYILKHEMPYDELQGWVEYFERRPAGWRSDLRAAYLMGVQGVKTKPSEIFPSLAAVMGNPTEGNATSTLRGSFMHSKILGAKGGVRLED
jgi:hypothetical protein